MTREKLGALKKLEAAATAGKWASTADTTDVDEPVDSILDHRGEVVAKLWPDAGCVACFELSQNDGRLIVAARNNLPQLIRIAEAAMDMMDSAKEYGVEKEETWWKLKLAVEGGDDDKR